MKKKTIGLLLAALLVLTSLWLPAPLGGAREAAASDGPMRETRGIIRVTKNAKLYNMPGTASTYSNSEVLYDISAGKRRPEMDFLKDPRFAGIERFPSKIWNHEYNEVNQEEKP